MKKLMTFLMMSILAIGVGWAAEVTYSIGTSSPGTWSTTLGGNNGSTIKERYITTDEGFTITQFNPTNTNNQAVGSMNANYMGLLATDRLTISGPVTITKIVYYFTYYQTTYSCDVGSLSGNTATGQSSNTLTWTGSATSITLTPDVGTKQNRLASITITYTDGGTQTCTMPTFSPVAGTYYEPQSVSIRCSTDGATIYYTTDGNDPTTSSSVYSTAIAVNSTTTIKAVAVKDGYDPSSVAEATYIISPPPEVQLNYENTLISGHSDFYIVDRTMGGLSQVWKDSKYGMTANGYGCNANVESWLYSPVFDATSKDGYTIKLDFEENLRYFASNDLATSQATLWVREGTTGEWQQLTITPHDIASGDDFHSINTVDLSSYAGKKFQLAFKYLATTSNPGRWEIKNLSVAATKEASSNLYIMGMINGNGEYPTRAVKMGYDGNNYTAKIWVIGNSSNDMGQAGSWMAFTTVLAENNDAGGWGYVNSNRYSPSPDNGNYYWLTNGTESDIPLTKQNNDKAFLIPAGLYEITVSGDLSKFSLNTIKDLTPTINPNGGEVNQYSTATVSISEDFNAFIADCNEVVYANESAVGDITPPVAKFYLNNDLVNGTSTNYQFNNTGSVTLTGKCTLVSSDTEYATKTATANFTVNEVTLGDDEYILVTSIGDLNTTDNFIIVSKEDGDGYAMSTEQKTNNRGATAITIKDSGATAVANSETQVFSLEEGNGGWYFYTGSGYIYAASSTANQLKTETTKDDNALAALTINSSNGATEFVFQGSNTRNELRFNYNNGNPLFNCYASTSTTGTSVYLYKKSSSTPPSNQVATPVINPGSGESSSPYNVYGGKQKITITCATDGATIYYTINGDDPTTNSTQYSAPFDLTSTGGNKIVKAIAVKEDMDNSAVATSYYLFKSPNGPSFDPASGTVRTEAFNVTINSEYEDAEIYFMLDPEGDEVPTATMLYTSDNLYSAPVNISGEGSHIIYALVDRNGIKSAVVNATYTISSGGQPAGEGDYVKVTSTADLTDGEYLIVYEGGLVAFDGSLETLDAINNNIEVEINNYTIASSDEVDAAIFIYDSAAGTLKSASGYYIGKDDENNGLSSSKEIVYTNTISIDADGNAVIESQGGTYLRYNAASNQNRFRYYGSGQKAVQLYKKIPPQPVVLDGVVFTTDRQWATWYGEEDLSLPNSDVKAYVVTGVEGDAVVVETVNYIPANTGVLLYSIKAASNLTAEIYTGDSDDIESDLKGVVQEETVNEPAYVLYNNQFVLLQEGTTVGAHRCYLPASALEEPGQPGEPTGAPVLRIAMPGTVTAINDLRYDSNGKAVGYYDLTGRYIGTSLNGKRGIFITSDGKKVVK